MRKMNDHSLKFAHKIDVADKFKKMEREIWTELGTKL